MSPEQAIIVESVGDAIRADPRPWSQLTEHERAVLHAGLMPSPSFTEEQREYLSKWWLPVTSAQLEALNAAAPANTTFAARDGYVCADLLSDALDGGRLAALLPILAELPLIYRLPEDWPAPAGDEE